MDRMSPLDAEFLHLEDGIAHMHIAALAVFEGPPPPYEELLALVERKLPLLVRYRQRVRSVPFELGRPVWVDDPHFELGYHVRHTALPSPGGETELRRLMGRLMSQPLDRNRPLWDLWVVEGLEGGRWAIVSKVHHCMVDGVAGVDLMTVLLETERHAGDGGAATAGEAWRPEPEPSSVALVLDAWKGLAVDLTDRVGQVPAAMRDPAGALRNARDTGSGLISLGRHLGPNPPLSIEGPIGPHRVWAESEASIDDIRTIRRAFGGTLNDVVLSAVAGGYREVLDRRGDDPDHAVVRTLVPVSVRRDDGRGTPDNRVSAILFELPVHLGDPLERLAAVHASMDELKGSHMADAGEVVTNVATLAPPMLLGTGSRLATRLAHRLPQRSVNTVTTNVPGPQFPLYACGRQMLSYFPYVPISHGVRIGTAILSYNGKIAFGVTGDFDTGKDVDVLADTIADGIADLRDRAR
jgi:diacylglycerol O-acyltransferase / wax synthase